jgi:hypothetical protein
MYIILVKHVNEKSLNKDYIKILIN